MTVNREHIDAVVLQHPDAHCASGREGYHILSKYKEADAIGITVLGFGRSVPKAWTNAYNNMRGKKTLGIKPLSRSKLKLQPK